MISKEQINILIIDDEKDILTTCQSVLEDEGYKAFLASDDIEAFKHLENNNINLVILDVWLPNIDGLNILKSIKSDYQNLPVIMMSGHAGVETAVRATKLGAYDFLEKPLSIDKLLSSCSLALQKEDDIKVEVSHKEENINLCSSSDKKYKVRQKTIKKSIVVSGFALMEGRKTALTLLPAQPNTGIVFIDMNTNTRIKLSPDNILIKEKSGLVNSTILVSENRSIRTTEHFLAALNMYGITNLIARCDGEVPNVDGSALVFCEALENAGILEQDDYTDIVVIDDILSYGSIDDDSKPYMIISPYDGFEITLRIDFPSPIGVQVFTYTYTDAEHFKNEIGMARSFNSIDNIDYAQKQGMAGSGLIGSHIILCEGKVINTKLHFDNEFVRHKILDIIGDMFILARGMRCKINANRTSHSFNHQVVMDIAKRYV